MTDALRCYVAAARSQVEDRGLVWDPPCGSDGAVEEQAKWNLNALAGLPPSRSPYLSSFGWNASDLAALNDIRRTQGLSAMKPGVMPVAWRDLLQAASASYVLINRYTPDAAARVGRAIRTLAMCAEGAKPGEIGVRHVQAAYNVSLRVADGVAKSFVAMIRRLFDALHLARLPNLYAHCTPYPDAASQTGERRFRQSQQRKPARTPQARQILNELHERKDALKLPDTRAFWEICRIVFTEEPKSILDLQLFAAARVHIVTGLRSAEVSLLPLDWERWHEWTDMEGRPAGERGGISRSLSIRHFARKQVRDQRLEGTALSPRMQAVPQMFESVILDTLREVELVTRPMRQTLERQHASGRLFPDLDPDALVPFWDIYVRLMGSILISQVPVSDEVVQRYVHGSEGAGQAAPRFDPRILDNIFEQQVRYVTDRSRRRKKVENTWKLNKEMLLVLHYNVRNGVLRLRDEQGRPMAGSRENVDWLKVRLLVSDVESHLATHGDDRRMSDREPFMCSDGTSVYPHDLLFLKTKWTRNDPLVHVGRYFSISRFKESELQASLSGAEVDRHKSLYARYGTTDEDRALTLNTHALRHLENTELFRLGVSDAIITKRFNRRSVAQSHVYDHRSLREHLDSISVPEEVDERLGPRAKVTYRLILSGRVSGPLVDEFRRVQRENGDDAAFDYLVAEADGLHPTPYGFCVNAFTVDPCPRHIECFNGCRHLARSDRPDEQQRLEQLRDRMRTLVAKVEAEPHDRVGRTNQLRHAQIRLENIERALAARPGAKPFPDGADLYSPPADKMDGSVLGGFPPSGTPSQQRAKPSLPSAGRPPGIDMNDA